MPEPTLSAACCSDLYRPVVQFRTIGKIFILIFSVPIKETHIRILTQLHLPNMIDTQFMIKFTFFHLI